MPAHLLFPGTFDPPTLGHVDLVRRALGLFESVTVAVAEHPTKDSLFSSSERADLFAACLGDLEGARVVTLEGLVVDGCARLECDAILRGVRSGSEYDYEARMAITNRSLTPGFETVLLVSSPEFQHITATLVRQIARMGGDVSTLVPKPVLDALGKRFGC